jgi:hypothetical protein
MKKCQRLGHDSEQKVQVSASVFCAYTQKVHQKVDNEWIMKCALKISKMIDSRSHFEDWLRPGNPLVF